MEFLESHFGENPWPLVLATLGAAVVCLALLLATQNGRHLVRGLVAVGLAGVLLLVDWAWTTDREKIAAAVSNAAAAVKRNDIAGIRGLLAPGAVYMPNGSMGTSGVEFQSPLGNTLLRQALDEVKFDFLSVRKLEVSAGRQTRRGKADFEVLCSGTWNPSVGGSAINFPPTTSAWSFGLQKQKDGRWLVDRITPTQMPGGARNQANLPGFLKR